MLGEQDWGSSAGSSDPQRVSGGPTNDDNLEKTMHLSAARVAKLEERRLVRNAKKARQFVLDMEGHPSGGS